MRSPSECAESFSFSLFCFNVVCSSLDLPSSSFSSSSSNLSYSSSPDPVHAPFPPSSSISPFSSLFRSSNSPSSTSQTQTQTSYSPSLATYLSHGDGTSCVDNAAPMDDTVLVKDLDTGSVVSAAVLEEELRRLSPAPVKRPSAVRFRSISADTSHVQTGPSPRSSPTSPSRPLRVSLSTPGSAPPNRHSVIVSPSLTGCLHVSRTPTRELRRPLPVGPSATDRNHHRRFKDVQEVLYCTVVCSVLYCTVLYCTVVCTVLYCTVQLCVLYCTVLFCSVLYCTVLY